MSSFAIPVVAAAGGLAGGATLYPVKALGRFYDFCEKGNGTAGVQQMPALGLVTWCVGVVPISGDYDQMLLRNDTVAADCDTLIALYLGAEDADGAPNGWPAGAPAFAAQVTTEGDGLGGDIDVTAAAALTLDAGQVVWVMVACDSVNRPRLYRHFDPYVAPSEPPAAGTTIHPKGLANPIEDNGRGAGDPAPTLAAGGFDLIDNGNGNAGSSWNVLWRLSA